MSHGREAKVAGLEARQGMYKMRSPAWKETYRNRCLERLRENRSKCHTLRRKIYEHSQCLGVEDEKEDAAIINDRGGSGDNPKSSRNSSAILSIEDIMELEWNHMSEKLQPQRDEDGSNYIDDMVLLYEEVCSELKREIQNDLKREEEHLLQMQKVWEAEQQYQEDELCSAVESLTTEEVICPICEKCSLIENKGVILCACGLRIDTEQDCI
ncbi:hypothetical protein EGW08_013077, partial [Elysia chlorotica]